LAESQFEEGIRQILFFRQLQNLDRNCLRGFLRENNMEDMVPGDISIQAEGYGVSKSDALLKAKREAVERGIGTVLISQTEVRNFELKKDIILSKTVGSVKTYDILKEEKQPDNTFYIKIRAVVSLASIKSDLAALKILLESMDKPRMMVVISEEEGKVAEGTIIDYLNEKEFELVDPSVVAALFQKDDQLIKQATEGDPAAAAKIGVSNGAEYVIVGRVTKSLIKSEVLTGTGMTSGQAHITAKVINCSNARIIASKSANSAAVHISEDIAKAKAAEKTAKKLMDRALFEKIVSNVKGVSDFKMQKAVREMLSGLSQVVSVNKRSFGGGKLQLSVLYKGNADSFSEEVDGKTVEGKIISVTGISGDKVDIEIK
jgi:hypothetical protein